jgi:butyrate kinase
MKEVEIRIRNGDKAVEEILCVMAYMVAKDIGAMATTVSGRIDNIIFTGGIAHSDLFTALVRDRVGWIAPILTVPGSFEMEALAHGVLRIYREEERAKTASMIWTTTGKSQPQG